MAITPEKQSEHGSAFRVAVLLALTLGTVAVLNMGAGRYLAHNSTNFGYRTIQAKWDLLEETEPVDWLILGDSSAAHGLDPAIWDAEMGGKSVNLAINARMLVVNSAWMIERYIERHGAPKNVLIMHTFDIWHRRPVSVMIGKVPLRWGFWERMDPSLTLEGEAEKKVALSRFLPLYAESKTLKEHLVHLGPKKPREFGMHADGFRPGWKHSSRRLARDVRRTQKYLARNSRVKIARENADALKALRRMVREHDFELYLVKGPVAHAVTELKNYESHTQSLNAKLERFARRDTRVHFVSEQLVFKDSRMEIADHVTPKTVPLLTRKVAALVADAAKKGR